MSSMTIRDFLMRHDLGIPRDGKHTDKEVSLRHTDVFEAWDLYSMLRAMEPMEAADVRKQQGARYGLGLVYVQHLLITLKKYQKAVIRRKHNSCDAAIMTNTAIRDGLMPLLRPRESKGEWRLSKRDQMKFIQQYEQILKRVMALQALLQDIIGTDTDLCEKYLADTDTQSTFATQARRRGKQ